VIRTEADITYANAKLGFDPKTQIAVGVPNFVRWYREYYKK
jgi:nucleoside-diphosphate-sugar epimerase